MNECMLVLLLRIVYMLFKVQCVALQLRLSKSKNNSLLMKVAQRAHGYMTFVKSMTNFVEKLDMVLDFRITICPTDFHIIDLI